MSSDDCKDLLQQLALENSWPLDSKWKRKSKYKDGEVSIREFENQYGHKAVVAQENGSIYLLSSKVNSIQDLPDSLKKTLTHENLFKGLIKELLTNKDFTDLAGNYQSDEKFNEAIYELAETSSWNKMEKALKKYDYTVNSSRDNYGLTQTVMLSIYMSSYAQDLAKNFFDDISPDAVGVNYDLENVYAYFKSVEGLEFATVEMGGDWETPVYAIIYWSEKDQKVKGFFPKEKGNIYNVVENTAYGSDMENYHYNQPSKEAYQALQQKYESMRDKIEEDSEKHYKKALKEGVKQWKEHLLATEV